MASICCPIELEPRTLSQGQLNQAREVAADVVQKMEAGEASNIFIGGMKPVVPIRKEQESVQKLEDDIIDDPKKARLLEKPCQCLCDETVNSIADSPDNYVDALKEPLSAPF